VVARTWLQIRVELVGGRGMVCEPRPGRVMMVGPGHTFAVFAEAIDAAFARWDLSHLHSFELADGRLIGFPDPDFDEPRWLDHAALKVAAEVAAGDEFLYTFDFGDDWRHECRVLPEKVDPRVEYGPLPKRPVAIWGWGWIPDQYGRETLDDDGV
jgi:hypothetical protein